MSKKAPPAWQLPAIIGGCVVGLGAIGTFIVRSATYITLPDKVEAAVQKNVEQDEALNKLTAIQETWQNIYQQQQQQAPNQAAPAPTLPPNFIDDTAPTIKWWWEQNRDGAWYCTDGQDSWWPDAEGRCE